MEHCGIYALMLHDLHLYSPESVTGIQCTRALSQGPCVHLTCHWVNGHSTTGSRRSVHTGLPTHLRYCIWYHYQGWAFKAFEACPWPMRLQRRDLQASRTGVHLLNYYPSPRAFPTSPNPIHVCTRSASGPNPTPGRSPFKVWPFVAIALLGSYSYTLMVKSRIGQSQKPRGNKISPP